MYKKTKLKNGINVITTHMPSVRSFAIGIYFKACSNYESEYTTGISHLIEHMMFKGTEKYSAKEIAEKIDNIGGSMNAYTSKDCTSYYAKVLYEHADIAIELLADMLSHSLFNEDDLAKEIDVVKEEIALYDDSPEDVCYDKLQQLIYSNHPLAEPVLGYYESVEKIKRQEIMAYLNAFYSADNMTISVAGYLPENIISQLEKYFGGFNPVGKQHKLQDVIFNGGYIHTYKDIEQTHLCLGFQSVPYDHPDHYATVLISNMFGGTSSSILYQMIREQNGLTYAIYSHPTFFIDSGHFSIYTAFQSKHTEKLIPLITDAIHALKTLFDEDKLALAKDQLKGAYILGIEGCSSIMSMYGKRSIYGAELRTMDEIMAAIDAISLSQVRAVIQQIFSGPMALSMVGRLKDTDVQAIYTALTEKL